MVVKPFYSIKRDEELQYEVEETEARGLEEGIRLFYSKRVMRELWLTL